MKQLVLGTAGHIDHGKTSLVKALTGIDTDRLKEEKERGITIELGFAHLKLPNGALLGIVDVPGHEKFVKNMVAGATGIDLVALIVAADEGIMPQTREHLEICQLLNIRHGLVVITKTDLVDEEWLELVHDDVEEHLKGTFLEGAPVVAVSSATGQGIPRLLEVLDAVVQEIPEKDPGHLFRLPVDRVFTIRGFGTVVTGTTVSGRIRVGEEVTIYPQQIPSRVRSLHVHNQEMQEARSGLRTAVNLQGVERSTIARGNVVATKNALRPTTMVDTALTLLPSAPRKLKHRSTVRFHTGTSEIISTLLLLDRDELEPGESCFAQLSLRDPTAVLKGDRFVLRSYSPVRTIGGGEILDPLARRKKRRSASVLEELRRLSEGTPEEAVEVLVRAAGFRGREEPELSFLANLSQWRLKEVLDGLKARRRLILYDKDRSVLIHETFLNRAREELLKILLSHHRQFPLKAGLSKEELRSRTVGARNPKLFHFLISRLTQEGEIVQDKEMVRHRDHRVTLAEDQAKARQELEQVYRDAGLQPPYFKEIKDKIPGASEAVLEVMVQEGVLVKVKEDLYFHQEALEELREELVNFLHREGEISTPQFKDMTGASRKYTIPLIEYFDKAQVTVRVGDNRVLRKK